MIEATDLPRYRLRHCRVRERRGMKCWAVMARQPWLDEADKAAFPLGVYFAVEAFHTEAEAVALYAKLTGETVQ